MTNDRLQTASSVAKEGIRQTSSCASDGLGVQVSYSFRSGLRAAVKSLDHDIGKTMNGLD